MSLLVKTNKQAKPLQTSELKNEFKDFNSALDSDELVKLLSQNTFRFNHRLLHSAFLQMHAKKFTRFFESISRVAYLDLRVRYF